MAYRPPAVALAVVSGGVKGDFEPPVANLLQPEAGSVTNSQQPLVLVSFSDAGSGVDRGSLRLYLDGNRVFEGEDLKENTLSYLPPFPLAPGQHLLEMVLEDLAGNRAIHRWTFGVVSLDDGFAMGGWRLSGINTFSSRIFAGPAPGAAENELAVFGVLGAGGLAGRNRNSATAALKLRSVLGGAQGPAADSWRGRLATELASYTLSWQGENHQMVVGDNRYPANPWLVFSQKLGKSVCLRIFPGGRQVPGQGAAIELFWGGDPKGGPEATGLVWRSVSSPTGTSRDFLDAWEAAAFLAREEGALIRLYDLRLPAIALDGTQVGMELAASQKGGGEADGAFRIMSIRKHRNIRLEGGYERVGAKFFNGLNPVLETDRNGVYLDSAVIGRKFVADIRLGRWWDNLRRERPDTLQKSEAGLELEIPMGAGGTLTVGFKRLAQEVLSPDGEGPGASSEHGKRDGWRNVAELRYFQTWDLFGTPLRSSLAYSRDLTASGAGTWNRERGELFAGTILAGFQAEGYLRQVPVEQVDLGQAGSLASRGGCSEGELRVDKELLAGKAKFKGWVMARSQQSTSVKVYRTEWGWGGEYKFSRLSEINLDGGYRLKRVVPAGVGTSGSETFATIAWVRRF
ncbi:MAG: hypothetical protein M1379_17325 [Firmicutes bacterium]|nr:hypothetical protein [Bacillota bacterium]